MYNQQTNNMQQLINKIYPELIAMVKAMTKNSSSATDLVHDVILSFLKYSPEKQNKIVADGKLKEYLYIACKTQYNSANSKYHTNYRQSQILNYDNEVDVYDLDVIDEDEINNDELTMIMKAINKHCTKQEKQMIADRFIENKTYREIAEKNNMPTYKATNQIKQILTNLNKQITDGNL